MPGTKHHLSAYHSDMSDRQQEGEYRQKRRIFVIDENLYNSGKSFVVFDGDPTIMRGGIFRLGFIRIVARMEGIANHRPALLTPCFFRRVIGRWG